ncbi:MAG: acyltransferase [Cytophagales bacterium]|nr:acyltransferase [Cytophagales bacterium]
MSYLPGLDGLRGYAVLMVIVFHWLPGSHWLNRFVPLGLLGVTCFFILSGYLITSILINARRSTETGDSSVWWHLGRFFYRRTLRIFPIYYLALLYLYLFNVADIRSSLNWHVFYASDLYFFFKQAWQGPISHLWTLSVEEKFYLFWPWLLLFVRSKQHGLIIVGTLVAGLLFEITTVSIPFARFTTPACLSSFAIGAALTQVNLDKLLEKVSATLLLVLAGVFVTVTAAIHLQVIGPAYLHFTFKLAAAPLILFVLCRVKTGKTGTVLQTMLCNPVMLYMGRISYGLYLYHNFVTPVWNGGLYTNLLQQAVLLLLVASASYYCIEKPLLSLKNKI